MKSTGIVRRIDTLGRIVLPIEIRRIMDMDIKDPLEIFVEGETIILEKYKPRCVFCSKTADVTQYKEKSVCAECKSELQGK